MASGVVTKPISVSLADFLATAVSDGTYADIVSVTKTDAASPGPTPASQIEEYGGQLYSNLVDDMWLIAYQAQYKGAKWWTVADATARDALGSDDALAVNDLLFQVSDKTLWYCTAVTGGATSTWSTIAALGDLTGPASSTDEALARFDGVTGKLVQNSVALLSDTGALSGLSDITLSGTVDGRDIATDGATLDSHVADVANPHLTNLAGTLAAGNTTTGSDVEFSAGDALLANENTTVPGGAPAAGKGTIWVRDDVPNVLVYTDDGGTDHDLVAGSSGDVAGPGSSTDEALARFDGATGKILQNGVVLASDTGVVTGVLTLNGVTVETHSARHENGGADEIDVTDLSGLLADPQTAIAAAGSDTTAIHVDIPHEISAISSKADPIAADWMVIEDSEDDGEKKSILISALPAGTANTLAATLTAGNTTGGTDIEISSGDTIISPAGGGGGAGGTLPILAGTGDAAGAGGAVQVFAGTGGATGTGGLLNLRAGTGGATSGGGGTVLLTGGSGGGTFFAGGSVDITGGAATAAGNEAGGNVNITGGASSGTQAGGDVLLTGGLADSAATINGGIGIEGGTGNGNIGGNVLVRSGPGHTQAAGGLLQLLGGNGAGTGEGGSIIVRSGSAPGVGAGGDLTLESGESTSGTVGEIIIRQGGTDADSGVSHRTATFQTTTATANQVMADAATGISVNSTNVMIDLYVTGHDSSTSLNIVSARLTQTFYKEAGGLVGMTRHLDSVIQTGMTGADVDLVVNGTDVEIHVDPPAGPVTINWTAHWTVQKGGV